jgi:hypothetical protein
MGIYITLAKIAKGVKLTHYQFVEWTEDIACHPIAVTIGFLWLVSIIVFIVKNLF